MQRVACVRMTKHMVATVKMCMDCHVKWWANHAASHPLPSMEVSRTMWSTGKKTAKSRLGVIHSWMLDMHSKVACSLAMPEMKHVRSRSGMKVECMVMRLQMAMMMAEVHRSC